MELDDAVVGARQTPQTIVWLDHTGAVLDLTDRALSGMIENKSTGVARAVDGALEVADPAAGTFTWAYGDTDVSEAGEFFVQFTATHTTSNLKDRTEPLDWVVHRAL